MEKILLVIGIVMQFKDTRAQISIGRDKRSGLKFANFIHLHRHRLDVVPRETLEVDKEIGCISKCMKKHDCFSMNVRKIAENGKFLCQLLNTSMHRFPDNMTKDDASVHWYLQDPCVPSPCKNNGKCVPPSLPEPGGKGTSCECLARSFGDVCQCFDSSHNFALRKPTNQSSMASSSWRAVDGNRNGNFPGGSCTQTHDAANQWWRVDLEQTIPVRYVVITNRADCCPFRLNDFEIKIGDSLVDDGRVNPKCGDRHNLENVVGTENITCSPPLSGRYVLVETFSVHQILTICELEVYVNPC